MSERVPRKALVWLELDADFILGTAGSDEAVGKVVRRLVRSAHEELKKLVPTSTTPTIRAALTDWEDPEAFRVQVRKLEAPDVH